LTPPSWLSFLDAPMAECGLGAGVALPESVPILALAESGVAGRLISELQDLLKSLWSADFLKELGGRDKFLCMIKRVSLALIGKFNVCSFARGLNKTVKLQVYSNQ